ncbi:MAG TPA: 16S rRNA (uracil(1498)-N(3))-methyltransferase [Caulobacteraceae bacterium]|nr:16S rRNA (uracil(1498)-N(3))-methyltransferase [Caulobacteraceae bacterium]
MSLIRLHVADDLVQDGAVFLGPQQTHYLANVMRARMDDEVLLFNGRDGEWLSSIVEISRRGAGLRLLGRHRPQAQGPDLDLLIAVVKRPRLETIIEKAAELGARRVRPVITARTNASQVNLERLHAIATEAAEQTGRLDVPQILEVARLAEVLAEWPGDRRLLFCDEAGEAATALDALAGAERGLWAILIGPEGGFTAEERLAARAVTGAVPVSLGPRILRADTAAIAALSLWQASLGDWRGLELSSRGAHLAQ